MPPQPQAVSWQAPPFEDTDVNKLGFCTRAIQWGRTWVEDHINRENIQKAQDILAGKSGGSVSTKWSSIATGDLKRGVRECVETLADIRPFWGYSTNNKTFQPFANTMNMTVKSVYLESFVDRAILEALQFAAVCQCGFIYPFWSRDRFGSGEGKFSFMALGQLDVLPVQLPRDRDYQRAYVVTLAIPYGVAEAHARWPLYQQFLKPWAQKRYGRSRGGEASRNYDRERWRMHGLDTQLELYTDVYFHYILDLRINYGEIDAENKPVLDEKGNRIGKEMHMGEWTTGEDGKMTPSTSWSYVVPYVGQTITRFEGGREVTRTATEDDCRVYPYRRLMISCDKALMYDGPAFDLHGMVPLIPFYFDKWAWGDANSLFDGTASIQDAIDDLVRSIYRVAMARARPGKAYNTDITTPSTGARLTQKQAEGMDPFDPDLTWGVDGDLKEPPLKPPMPEWCYNIPEWLFKVIELLQNSIMRQLGLDQIKALEKLRANIQDPEKALDAEGPVVMGTSRSMEMGLRDLGEMMKWSVPQYMTVGRIMQYVGPESIAPEIFDYSPESLTPSHLPGEQTINEQGEHVPSAVDPYVRLRNFLQSLRYFITPHSLHYIAQNKFKLNLLAAQGKGVIVDPETMANAFEIPNWGSIEGSTVKEKVFNWAKEQLTEKAEIAKLAKALGMGGDDDGEHKPGPPPGQGGRPQTNQNAPKAKQKGAASGGRVVVTTAK
jgi:hypothetical protein